MISLRYDQFKIRSLLAFPQNIRDYCIKAFDGWKRPTVLHFPPFSYLWFVDLT